MFPKECESFPSLWRFSKAAYTSRLQMFYNAQRLKTWKEKTEWHYCPLLCLPIVWWSLTFSHFVAAWMNQAVKTDMSQDIIENIISLFFQYCLQFLNFLWLHLFICNTTNGKLEFFSIWCSCLPEEPRVATFGLFSLFTSQFLGPSLVGRCSKSVVFLFWDLSCGCCLRWQMSSSIQLVPCHCMVTILPTKLHKHNSFSVFHPMNGLQRPLFRVLIASLACAMVCCNANLFSENNGFSAFAKWIKNSKKSQDLISCCAVVYQLEEIQKHVFRFIWCTSMIMDLWSIHW